MNRFKNMALWALWSFAVAEAGLSIFTQDSALKAFIVSLVGAIAGTAVWFGISGIAGYLAGLHPAADGQ